MTYWPLALLALLFGSGVWLLWRDIMAGVAVRDLLDEVLDRVFFE